MNTTRRLLFIGIFCAFFFFYGLSAFGLLGADEPRYAQVAREMLARNDWVTPTLWGQPWLEKPVLYYWSAMISYSLFGVRDWAARVPSAFYATLMVVAIFIFLWRFRRGTEITGALVACSSAAIFGFARGASTDMPLAACFTIAMLAWLWWREAQSRSALLLFYFFVAAATLAKGPVAPGLAAIVIIAFALVERRPRIIAETLWWPGILLFLTVAAPWYVLVQLRNPQFVNEFFLQQNLERFGTNLYHHAQPFWFYLPVLVVGLFPWTVFAIASLVDVLRDWRIDADDFSPARRWLVIWAVVPVIFFSLSESKLPGYILPAVPAWSILTADYLEQRREHVAPMRSWIVLLHALFIAVVAFAVMLAARWMLHPGAAIPWNVSRMAMFVAIAVFVTVFLLVRISGWEMVRFATLLPTILAVGFVIRIDGPLIDNTQSGRPVAAMLTTYGRQTTIAAAGLHRGVQYGIGFYRDQRVYSYDEGEIPRGRHLLIVPAYAKFPRLPEGKWTVSPAGEFGPQQLNFLWMMPVAR